MEGIPEADSKEHERQLNASGGMNPVIACRVLWVRPLATESEKLLLVTSRVLNVCLRNS